MTAKEIRETDSFNELFYFREIAAQLADLNELLRGERDTRQGKAASVNAFLCASNGDIPVKAVNK